MADETSNAAHQHGPGCFFCNTALPLVEKLWTEATKDHFRNSRIEFLKGMRSLIDDRLQHLTREQETKGTHVTVE
jgi:NAD dependent epimerase/dehydratase family enzyme